MADDLPSRRGLDLGADKADVLFGLALCGVLLVIAAFTADIQTATALLLCVATVYFALALVITLIRRNLKRGLWDTARWTFGSIGRWFSFW